MLCECRDGEQCVDALPAQLVIDRATRLQALFEKSEAGRRGRLYEVISQEMLSQIRYTEHGQKKLAVCVCGLTVCVAVFCQLSFLGRKKFFELKRLVLENKTFVHEANTEDQAKKSVKSSKQRDFVRAMEQLVEDFGESIPNLAVRNPRKDLRVKRKKAEHDDDDVIDAAVSEASSDEDEDTELNEHIDQLRNAGDLRVPVYIPGGLYANKQAVYEEFIRFGLLSPNFTANYFRRLWSLFYWHVYIKRFMPFAKCDDCVNFTLERLAHCKDAEKVELIRAHQKAHRDQVQVARNRIAARELVSRRFPALFGHLYDDAMDNTKTNTPHCRTLTFSKNIEQNGLPLKTKMMGVFSTGRSCMRQCNSATQTYFFPRCRVRRLLDFATLSSRSFAALALPTLVLRYVGKRTRDVAGGPVCSRR